MCNYIRLLYLKSINFGCALCFLRYSQTYEERLNLAESSLWCFVFSKENYGVKRDKTAMAEKIIYFFSH